MSNIDGVAVDGSQRASDLDMKLTWLRERHGGRVATFATATPIANSVAEAYTMQRFLRPDLLDDANLTDFDTWAATFGEVTSDLELAPDGSRFRMKSRLAKFRNVPELLRIWHVSADIKTAEDLKLPTPDLRNGQAETVVVPANDQLREFMRELSERADKVQARQVKPDEDNMLRVATHGRMAALDLRLLGRDPGEDGKLTAAANRIAATHHANAERRYADSEVLGALQLVFSDLGTPAARGRGTGLAGDWNVYDQLKQMLVDRGVPTERIRFVHDARNDKEKGELFAACRNGRVSVLLGSTEKMGVGTNVQARAVALHHLDCPWRPADIAQREDRILRQGNQNPEVEVIRYVAEGSFDAYLWQTVERKARFIGQVMRGSLDVREIEDVGETALSYSLIWTLGGVSAGRVQMRLVCWCGGSLGEGLDDVLSDQNSRGRSSGPASAGRRSRHRGRGRRRIPRASGQWGVFAEHDPCLRLRPAALLQLPRDAGRFELGCVPRQARDRVPGLLAKCAGQDPGRASSRPGGGDDRRGYRRAGATALRLSIESVARALAAVSAFYEYAIAAEQYVAAEHPLQKVPDLASLRVSDRRRPMMGNASRQRPLRRTVRVRRVRRLPRPADRDQHIGPLLACLKTRRDRAIYLLMVNGGLRPSEVLCLQLDDVAYGRRRVVVRNRPEDPHPKGARGKSRKDRVVDLHDGVTLAAISDYVMHERPTPTGSRWLFLVGGNGPRRSEPLGYDAVVRGFSRRCERLGIRQPWLTPHALRHSHATEMWDGGMREMTLQKRLGHASPESTQIYTRVSDVQVVKDYQRALLERGDRPDAP